MAEAKKKSVFEVLSAIDCNGHTEKKNGLTYLSWAWAWQIAKTNYPGATFTVYENAEGLNYHHDGRTCWVKTGVTIEGIEMIEYLPVMDYKNQSVPFAKVTSMDVNKAIQRSLTKAIARHGLGLYIYAGEDIPDASDDAKRAEVNKAIPQPEPESFDAELETAISDLKAAKSRAEVGDINKRYREIYGTYSALPNPRYIDALREMSKKFPKPTATLKQ